MNPETLEKTMTDEYKATHMNPRSIKDRGRLIADRVKKDTRGAWKFLGHPVQEAIIKSAVLDWVTCQAEFIPTPEAILAVTRIVCERLGVEDQ